jgi:hypothetical protein
MAAEPDEPVQYTYVVVDEDGNEESEVFVSVDAQTPVKGTSSEPDIDQEGGTVASIEPANDPEGAKIVPIEPIASNEAVPIEPIASNEVEPIASNEAVPIEQPPAVDPSVDSEADEYDDDSVRSK